MPNSEYIDIICLSCALPVYISWGKCITTIISLLKRKCTLGKPCGKWQDWHNLFLELPIACILTYELAFREAPGNVAPADLPDAEMPEAGAAAKLEEADEERVPLIPRKRMRKGHRDPPEKRQRSEEPPDIPEEAPAPRLTRAAIKAEEEAQEEMDVLSALAGEYNTDTNS